jgi:hypothetical protein
MKTIKLFPTTLLIFLLSCQLTPLNPTVTDTPIPETVTATPSRIPTKSPTITATPNPYVHFQCPEIVKEIPEGLELEGTIVLEGNQDNYGLFLFDLKNNIQSKIPNYNPWYYTAVSPNGELIAYQLREDTDQRFLAIADAGNTILKTIPWQDSWYEVVRWVNDEQLTIAKTDEISQSYKNERMAIVMPFKDMLKYVRLDELGYPDYAASEPWVEYDPTFKRVVYLSYTTYILLDTESREVLATVPGSGLEPMDVAWSRNGEHIAIIGFAPRTKEYFGLAHEIYILSRNGDVKRTYFDSYYKDGLSFYKPSWSPDEKYIAVWESDYLGGDLNDWKLSIIDATTNELTSYCISSDRSGAPYSPVWSPNGQQIVVASQSYPPKSSDPVYMIDIPNNLAVEITENANPVGWMISKP